MLVAGWSGVAMAQVNCETIRAGPDRTDCYIGVSRINREKSAIAAGVARQQSDIAIYRSVTCEDSTSVSPITSCPSKQGWWPRVSSTSPPS
jgi:hypothetical protein